MTTDVVWLSLRDETPNRGYWDEAMLERLFSDADWRPAGAHGFRHHESLVGVDKGRGAVVVLPARHHHRLVQQLNKELSDLTWVLLVLAGDEEGSFPFEDLDHPNMRLWVMTPQMDRKYPPGTRFIPNGPAPDAYRFLPSMTQEAQKRPYAWSFSGQVTHERREQCVEKLGRMNNGRLVTTPGFTQGLGHDEYFALMASTKVAPCPAGPCTPDTFRLWEALQAGALPLADAQSPGGRGRGFWSLLFGGDPPFPVVEDWGELPAIMQGVLSGWPDNANRVIAGYLQYLRTLSYHLMGDIDELSGSVQRSDGVDDKITVLVPTSPIASHPDMEIVSQTVESVREQLPQAEIVIMCDGVRLEQEDRRKKYEEYLRRLTWKCLNGWHNVVPVIFDEHLHQANITRATLGMVRTPYLLFVEHDTPVGGEIDWPGLIRVLDRGDAGVVRFNHETRIHPEHQYLTLGDCRNIDGVPLTATLQWSQRPHLARTSLYREMLSEFFGLKSRTMIEDVMHGAMQDQFHLHGVDGWKRFGLHIYTPPGNIQRSFNLDGRKNDPKYDMIITMED